MALIAQPEVAPFPGRPFSVTPETVQAASCSLKGWCWQALPCAHTQAPHTVLAPLLDQALTCPPHKPSAHEGERTLMQVPPCRSSTV